MPVFGFDSGMSGSFVHSPSFSSQGGYHTLMNINPRFEDEPTSDNAPVRKASHRRQSRAAARQRRKSRKEIDKTKKNALNTFTSMTMNELRDAVADADEAATSAQSPQKSHTTEQTCRITNSSFVENLGMLWEVALWHGPEKAADSELAATLLSPPVPRGESLKIQLPQRCVDGSQSGRWQLRIKSDHLSFQDGSTKFDVQPGEHVTVQSALEVPEMDQLQIIRLFCLATRYIESLRGSSNSNSEGSRFMNEEVWDKFATALGSDKNGSQLRNSFQTTRRIAASQGWTLSPHWLAMHATPAVQVVRTEELLRLLSSQQCKVQVSWRKLVSRAGAGNSDGRGRPDNPHAADLITVQATMMLASRERGNESGIVIRTFRNHSAQGMQFEACGPVNVRPFSTGSSRNRRDSGFNAAAKLILHGLRNVLHCKQVDSEAMREINSIAPMEYAWDSVEVLMFANPDAMAQRGDEEEQHKETNEKKEWPLVLRAHQYVAPTPEDVMPELNLSKADMAVGRLNSSMALVMGVSEPSELLAGASRLGRVLRKNAGATRELKSTEQWDSLMPLFLNW